MSRAKSTGRVAGAGNCATTSRGSFADAATEVNNITAAQARILEDTESIRVERLTGNSKRNTRKKRLQRKFSQVGELANTSAKAALGRASCLSLVSDFDYCPTRQFDPERRDPIFRVSRPTPDWRAWKKPPLTMKTCTELLRCAALAALVPSTLLA